jgi:hypothetical protein
LDHERRDMSEHRETANADMQQTIPRLAGDIAPFDDAQGRLRQGRTDHSFSQTCGSESHMFVKSGFHLVKRPVCISPAYGGVL